MHTRGVHEIPCTCGTSYNEQTRKYEKHVDYKRMEKSAVAEHSERKDHTVICYDGVKILSREINAERSNRETNFSRDDGWKISNAWELIIHQTKNRKQRYNKYRREKKPCC